MESQFGFIHYDNFPYLSKVEYNSDSYTEIILYIREKYHNTYVSKLKAQIMKFYDENNTIKEVQVLIVFDIYDKIIGYIWNRKANL